MRLELHEHQQRAVTMLRKSLGRGNTRPMMQAPTGFGKTVTAAAIVEGALEKGNKIMFVVPAISLINQTAEKFIAQGITEIGVIQAQHEWTNPDKPVQIASIQTLARRDKRKLPFVQVVVVDEAHKWFKFCEQWFKDWNGVIFIGLSATPWTKGLGKHYDDLLIAATTQDLIDKGFLSDFRVFAPSHPDLSGVKTVAGDYHEGQLAEVMGESKIVSDIVLNWREKAEGRNTLCFAVDRAHARKIQRDFLSSGIKAEYIDAYTSVEDREEIEKQFHEGDVQVVCSVGCLTTGIDWDVRCIILARPTKSEILFTQMIGRGLRTAEGKDYCLILDHGDTHLRLGFVTDIHHTKLDDGKHRASIGSKPKEALPKECPSCGILKPPKQHECLSCGFKPEKQSPVEPGEGDLAELTRAQKRNNKNFTAEQKLRFFGELKQFAKIKGFKPGWAANKYRERFGVWPDKYTDALPMQPSPETLSWIKSTQIRYAHSKKRRTNVGR